MEIFEFIWTCILFAFILFMYFPGTGGLTLSYTDNFDTEAIGNEIVNLVNQEREILGRSVLRKDSKLFQMAKSHSDDMIVNDYYEHSTYLPPGTGENILEAPHGSCGRFALSTDLIAQCMFDSWKDSSDHYRNMVDPVFSRIGVGIACDLYECKATQTFQ